MPPTDPPAADDATPTPDAGGVGDSPTVQVNRWGMLLMDQLGKFLEQCLASDRPLTTTLNITFPDLPDKPLLRLWATTDDQSPASRISVVVEEREKAIAERDALWYRAGAFTELCARIFRDGGHRFNEIGDDAKALEEADGTVANLFGERDALRAAAEPFARMARGIPGNWPGGVAPALDYVGEGPRAGLRLTYFPADVRGDSPSVDDYRRVAALAPSAAPAKEEGRASIAGRERIFGGWAQGDPD